MSSLSHNKMPKELFLDSSDSNIEKTFSELVAFLGVQVRRLTLPMAPDTDRVLEAFLSLPKDRRILVLEDLWTSTQLVSQFEKDTNNSKSGLNFEQELRYLKEFIHQRRLVAREDLFNLIDEGDIVEIYDSRGVQIYRNWTYFKYCSYSLVDLLVHDWNTLFMRPSWVVKLLMDLTPQIFAPGSLTYKYDLPEYLVTERLRETQRGMLFKMKYASPLLDWTTGRTTAFVTTGTLKVVPDLRFGMNVDLL